jgi:hypothetical protein
VADDPQLGELSRNLADFRRDVRDDFQGISGQLKEFVLREVYLADKTAADARIARLEKELEGQRSAARNAIYAAAGSVLASIVVGIVMAVVTKGGH